MLATVTTLAPMQSAEFDSFAELAIASYAEDNVAAGRWPPQGALARARAEFERLLPQGLHTPAHWLYEIRETEAASGEVIGFVWFAVLADGATRSGYLYHIRIKPQFRGLGHAKAALDRLDEIARAMGLSSIALHTFSQNGAAQALYRSQGYWITGMNMRKTLRMDDT